MPMLTRYLIAHLAYGARKTPDDFPLREEVWADETACARDILAGQIEDVARVVAIDLDAGTARDVTADVYTIAASLSLETYREPFDGLAAEFDRRRLEYHGLAERERAYLRGPAADMRIDDMLEARRARGSSIAAE